MPTLRWVLRWWRSASRRCTISIARLRRRWVLVAIAVGLRRRSAVSAVVGRLRAWPAVRSVFLSAQALTARPAGSLRVLLRRGVLLLWWRISTAVLLWRWVLLLVRVVVSLAGEHVAGCQPGMVQPRALVTCPEGRTTVSQWRRSLLRGDEFEVYILPSSRFQGSSVLQQADDDDDRQPEA